MPDGQKINLQNGEILSTCMHGYIYTYSFRYIHMHRHSKFLVVMFIVYSGLVKAHSQLKDHLQFSGTRLYTWARDVQVHA